MRRRFVQSDHARAATFYLTGFLACVALTTAPSSGQPLAHADELPAWSASLARVFAGKPPRGPEDLMAMEKYIQALSQKTIEATVSIRYGVAHGSGVIVSPDGIILTAAHVTSPRSPAAIVKLADGREIRARALGRHLPLDASLLKIEKPGPWPHLEMGKSNSIRQGHWCLAAGHPGGYVSDRGPVVRLGRVLQYDHELMRTDCRLSGGDSGGPLVDMRGQVIGIHSRIGTSLANNLHIPISVYRRHWEGLTDGNQWRGSSYLGVRSERGAVQAIVDEVYPDSPAEKAGIQPGDVITRFGGQRVFSFDQLPQLVQMRRPGEDVEVELLREGQTRRLEIRVGEREQSEAE